VRVWNAAISHPLLTPLGRNQTINRFSSVPLGVSGRRIVTASAAGMARVWDAHSGSLEVTLPGHDGAGVFGVAISPDGRRVVTACSDHAARVWDASNATPKTVLEGHEGVVTSAAFSPDGRRVATDSLIGPCVSGRRRAAKSWPLYQAIKGMLTLTSAKPPSARTVDKL
jgi:WD40 repeat protein